MAAGMAGTNRPVNEFSCTIDRCFALVMFFMCVSDGLMASFKFEIHCLMDSLAESKRLSLEFIKLTLAREPCWGVDL